MRAAFGAKLLLLSLGAVASVAQAQVAPVCRPLDTPLPEAQRKFHPGHYISIGPAELGRGLDKTLSKTLADPIKGVQLRYRWTELEPEEGRYDFSAIATDLKTVARWDRQLVAVIEDKSFNYKPPPTPAYLQANHTVRSRQGYTAVRWDPYVNERLQKLVAAIGQQFDCDPNFEGIAFQESAPNLDDDVLAANGYTPEKYRDTLIALLRAASQSVPRSRVFWYMNFLPGGQQYIGDIATALAGTGVVMGGPDILPDNAPLRNNVYPFYESYHGRLPLFCSMRHPSYRHLKNGTSGYWTMDDLFLFARDKLHVDYLFWELVSKPNPPGAHSWADARAVITRYPTLQASSSDKSTTQAQTRSTLP